MFNKEKKQISTTLTQLEYNHVHNPYGSEYVEVVMMGNGLYNRIYLVTHEQMEEAEEINPDNPLEEIDFSETYFDRYEKLTDGEFHNFVDWVDDCGDFSIYKLKNTLNDDDNGLIIYHDNVNHFRGHEYLIAPDWQLIENCLNGTDDDIYYMKTELGLD